MAARAGIAADECGGRSQFARIAAVEPIQRAAGEKIPRHAASKDGQRHSRDGDSYPYSRQPPGFRVVMGRWCGRWCRRNRLGRRPLARSIIKSGAPRSCQALAPSETIPHPCITAQGGQIRSSHRRRQIRVRRTGRDRRILLQRSHVVRHNIPDRKSHPKVLRFIA